MFRSALFSQFFLFERGISAEPIIAADSAQAETN
jgi:hypothetical protein